MKKLLFTLLSPFICVAAFAANAAPLGFELGTATLAGVKSKVSSTAQLQEGVSSLSGGKLLSGNGRGLGIEGLSAIIFVFDDVETLVGVIMSMSKGGFEQEGLKRVVAALDKKYKAVEKRLPMVGDVYVKYVQGASLIQVEAPHMSFDFDVTYTTTVLAKQIQSKASEDDKARRRTQESKF